MTSRWMETINIDHLTTPDGATDTPLKVPAPTFKLDLIERHPKAVRPNLLDPATVIKVDVAEANMACALSDRPTTFSNGFETQAALIIVAMVMPVVMMLVAMSAMDIGQFHGA